MMFQEKIHEALSYGESRHLLYRVPSKEILQKIAREAATWELHVSIFRGRWANFSYDDDQLLIDIDESGEMAEVVWHWPGEPPELESNGKTEDDTPYWRDKNHANESYAFTTTTPELISST